MHKDNIRLLNPRNTQAASTQPSGVSFTTDHSRVLEMATLSNPNNASACTGPAAATVTPDDRAETIRWMNQAMVVATLIVTVTFQAAVTPPGGAWQQGSTSNITTSDDRATSQFYYDRFVIFDILTFGASFCALSLFQFDCFIVFGSVILGTSMGLLGWTFFFAIHTINPSPKAAVNTCLWVVVASLVLLYITAFINYFRKKRAGQESTERLRFPLGTSSS